MMKYLCSPQNGSSRWSSKAQATDAGSQSGESRCHVHLREWAGSLRLVVAAFYFWNSGMDVQTTQFGLLRTLLHRVITQCPEIIPQIASKQWESMCLFDALYDPWTVQQLHDMLLRAIDILKDDSKICLFIDGLDEFSSSHDNLIHLIKGLIGGRSYVKICVASRPWTVFQDAFDCHPNLRLEDLIFDDIKAYVDSRFKADIDFNELRK